MTAQNIAFQVIPRQGNSVGSANILVVQHLLSTPIALFADAGLTTPISNPVTVDSTGNVDFWVADNSIVYDGFISGGYVINRQQITNLASISAPYAVNSYNPKFFTLDFVPELGGNLKDLVATVVYHNSQTPIPLFADEALTTLTENPIVLESGYNISFWIADSSQQYDIKVVGDSLIGVTTIQNIWDLPGPVWADKSLVWQNEPQIWAWINPYQLKTKQVQNVGQLYTANDLIRASMRLIQVAAVDTQLTASELQDGLESLNRMIDSWSLDSLMLYQVVREQFQLVTGDNPYTIGYGAQWNTSRPMKIIDAYLELNNGSIPVDYPMAVINWDDYNAIRLKTLSTNFPAYLYYDCGFPIGNIYIYPIFSPNDPSTIGPAYINITSWKPFDVIVDPTAYIELPPGYWEAIVFNLAVRIAEEYQFDIRPQTVELAMSAMKRIKRMNTKTPTLQTDAALMNTSQMRYNIYSDSFGR